MKNSKKIFLVIAVLFLAAVAVVMYDMSSRTTSPWQKKNETLKEQADTVPKDSVKP